MYYIIDFSTEQGIIGSQYPQIQEMTKGYDYNASNSVHKVGRCYEHLPDFTPNFDGFVLHRGAKLTDFISQVFTDQGFIISKKAKNTLEKFTLPEHQFYPIKLYHISEEIKNYYWLHIISDLTSLVDYRASSFYIYKDYAYDIGSIEILSKEDFLYKKHQLKQNNKGQLITIWAKQLTLKEKPHFSLFNIGTFDSKYYISKNLKNAFQKENITGLNFVNASDILLL